MRLGTASGAQRARRGRADDVGVNYMREHMPSTARIHYAMNRQRRQPRPMSCRPRRTVRYLIRARDLPQLHALLRPRREDCEGAALMTETAMRHQIVSGDANLIGNTRSRR